MESISLENELTNIKFFKCFYLVFTFENYKYQRDVNKKLSRKNVFFHEYTKIKMMQTQAIVYVNEEKKISNKTY